MLNPFLSKALPRPHMNGQKLFRDIFRFREEDIREQTRNFRTLLSHIFTKTNFFSETVLA